MKFNADTTWHHCHQKIIKTAGRLGGRIPYQTINGQFTDFSESNITWWTNGFWPGLLWLVYDQTADHRLAEWAMESEMHLDRALLDYFGVDHDAGFIWHLSAVAQYRRNGSRNSLRRGLMAASFLASRFNLHGRYLRAWNRDHVRWAIIDAMMNLPLLYWASEETRDPRFRQIAVAHTETVLQYFLRADGSSRHIVEFDEETGTFVASHRGQGYAEESAWSRGCAWLLHGMSLGARATGRTDFLAAAELSARYFLDNLPPDQVPWCDFKGPEGQAKDSSAAAIAASGLLTLAELVPASRKGLYQGGAQSIIDSLAQHYLADAADEALLLHGCVAYHMERMKRPSDRDTSLIYGDYFFMEALVKLRGGHGLF